MIFHASGRYRILLIYNPDFTIAGIDKAPGYGHDIGIRSDRRDIDPSFKDRIASGIAPSVATGTPCVRSVRSTV